MAYTSKRVRIYYFKADPPNTKRVSRPSKWGNPFRIPPHTREDSLRRFEAYLKQKLEIDPDFLEPLRGFNLGCFCKPEEACHADIILKYLNR